MAVTILDAAYALDASRAYERAVMETYVEHNDLMRAMRWETIPGNAYSFNREGVLPTVAFRGLNEGYIESTGKLDPVVETLMIAGGDIDVDKYLADTGGADVRADQLSMKVKALSMEMVKAILKGDHASDPHSFDGLQARLTGNQLIEAKDTPTAGGDALSLAKMDELKDSVQRPTHWVMNKTMRSLLSQAARDYQIGGFVTFDKDEFGNRITVYDDMPILIVDEDSTGAQILPFTEAGAGGGASLCTSIYCLSLTDDGFVGLQNGVMSVRDLGELEDKPVYRTRIEWYIALAMKRAKSAARLRGIKSGAVTKVPA
jgi:hypothetical protein